MRRWLYLFKAMTSLIGQSCCTSACLPSIMTWSHYTQGFLCTIKLLFTSALRSRHWDAFHLMSLWRAIAQPQLYMLVPQGLHCSQWRDVITARASLFSSWNRYQVMWIASLKYQCLLAHLWNRIAVNRSRSRLALKSHHHQPVSGVAKGHSCCHFCSRSAKTTFTLSGVLNREIQRKAECLQ